MIASESKGGLLQTAGEDCFRHTGRTNSNVSKLLFEGQEMIASKDKREKLQRRGYDFIRRKERIENFRKLEKVALEDGCFKRPGEDYFQQHEMVSSEDRSDSFRGE